MLAGQIMNNNLNNSNNNNALQQQQQPLNGSPPINQQQLQSGSQQCIRQGCPNQAIVNGDWEDEYCSNECVITHCRLVLYLF